MKRWAVLCGAILLFAAVASAQESPRAEVFGGYSYLHFNDAGSTANFNGGTGSFSYNLDSSIGIVGEFGAYHYSQGPFTLNIMTYMGGPKVAMRGSKFTTFVQTLFGAAHATSGTFNSDNAFAMALGGGLDMNLTPRVDIRLVQADWMYTKFSDSVENHQNHVRVSTGVVIRF